MKLSLISLTGSLVYLLLILSPLAIAISLDLAERPFLDQLSSALAILGFNLIFIEFLISGRIRQLSKMLGADWVLQIHQLMARTAAVFLLIHPLLYTLPNAPAFSSFPPSASYLGLTPGTAFTGMIGLGALVVLIILAITRHSALLKYEHWRISHALLAVTVALMGFHHATHAGRFSQENLMLRYWQIALGFALLMLAWVYLIRPILQRSRAYKVIKLQEVAHQIYELTIQRCNPNNSGNLRYQAGQFAWLKIKSTTPVFENPFSISSAPSLSTNEKQESLQFLIKDVGDFTHQVSQLEVDDLIYLDAPYGNFGQSCFELNENPLVFIAGGAGIAPIVSLLRGLMQTKNATLLQKPIQIIYGNRIEDQMINLSTMVNLQAFTRLSITPVITEPHHSWTGISGVLDQRNLEKILVAQHSDSFDRKQSNFYVCGPAEMIDSVESALTSMGVPLSHIESEKFHYDYSKKGARNRLSLLMMAALSAALAISAIYVSA